MTGARLAFDGVIVEADGGRILDVARLDIPASRTTVVLGANGAGKSTLLRVAAGLRTQTRGEVVLDERRASAHERRAATAAVLQRPLLGRGSARRNAELGLRFAGVPRAEAHRRANAWLERLGVAELADRPARALSGGEAQRVSLARALVLEPRLLVLDEPFAPLDVATRGELLGDLHELLDATAVTTLMVTHDPGEAAALADCITVLDGGAVRQVGAAADVFARPADAVTARLLGYDNVLEPDEAARFGMRSARPIGFRAADLEVIARALPGGARVLRSVPVAGASRVQIELGDTRAVGMCAALGGLAPGASADVRLASERCVPVGT